MSSTHGVVIAVLYQFHYADLDGFSKTRKHKLRATDGLHVHPKTDLKHSRQLFSSLWDKRLGVRTGIISVKRLFTLYTPSE